jgi:DNA polymerase-3 subunit epsilon
MIREIHTALHACCVWSRELLTAPDVVLLDTETTGLGPEDEVASIAILSPQGSVNFELGFRPEASFHPSATAVNGLTAETQADCSQFADFHKQIQTALTFARVVCFNSKFDRRLLDQTCDRYGLPPLRALDWPCAQQRAMSVLGSGKWVSLTKALHVWTGWPMSRCEAGAHGAVGDCRRLLALLQAMATHRAMNFREIKCLEMRVEEHGSW